MKFLFLVGAGAFALSSSLFAEDAKLPIITFEEGVAAILDVETCESQYVQPVAKAENAEFSGQNVVFIFTGRMVINGEVEYSAEPLAIGALKEPVSTSQLNSLVGKPVCDEPW